MNLNEMLTEACPESRLSALRALDALTCELEAMDPHERVWACEPFQSIVNPREGGMTRGLRIRVGTMSALLLEAPDTRLFVWIPEGRNNPTLKNAIEHVARTFEHSEQSIVYLKKAPF